MSCVTQIQGNLHLPIGKLTDLGVRKTQQCFLGSIPLDQCSCWIHDPRNEQKTQQGPSTGVKPTNPAANSSQKNLWKHLDLDPTSHPALPVPPPSFPTAPGKSAGILGENLWVENAPFGVDKTRHCLENCSYWGAKSIQLIAGIFLGWLLEI